MTMTHGTAQLARHGARPGAHLAFITSLTSEYKSPMLQAAVGKIRKRRTVSV
jgi:hypothetical protein